MDAGACINLKQLFDRAFKRGDPRRANELIAETREEVRQRRGKAFNYEVSLLGGVGAAADEPRGWPYIEQVVAPRLALYLKSKRMSVAACAPLFLSIFHGETLYFVAAPDFYDVVRAASGLDEEAFRQRAVQWERTGRPLALLPG